ncbi:MAG: hypothetical protein EA384_04495 [Spirochaetaceae bacterium]|nr:MAG: hypothetical protein EA384_04495 [Spirochaetaceae bacterium]
MKPLVLFCSLMLCLAVGAWTLESSDGSLTVRLDPAGGSFSLHAVGPGGLTTALLFEPDPRTSGISVLEGNRIHRMGTGGGFERSVEERDGWIGIRWRSATIEVEQRFTTSNGVSGVANGEVRVVNRSESARVVAVRYLLDTWLGEQREVHFVTGDGREIRSEYRMEPGPHNSYWLSSDGQIALFFLVGGEAITDADAVLFANWKRLKDARWDYVVRADRSFDLIPYSMNDSAAAVYYAPRTLQPGETYHISFVVGRGEGLARTAQLAPGRVAPATAVRERTPEQRRRPNDRAAIEAEIDRINALLSDINRRLESDRPVSDAEVEALRERLQQLQGDRSPL